MTAFVKKARVAHVWLTAILTLLAGLPRVQCRCPSGNVKPWCPSFLSFHPANGGCCCTPDGLSAPDCCTGKGPSQGRCCRPAADASPPDEAVPSCCAHAHRGKAEQGAHRGPRFAAPRCARTLVKATDVVLAPARIDTPAAPPGSTALLAPGFSGATPALHLALLSWQVHLLGPPPTDLVTVLHRLTI